MILAVIDPYNDCSFCLEMDCPKEDYDKVAELARAGLQAWYRSCHDDLDEEDTRYFTKEELDNFWGIGYAEPSVELLERYGYKAKIVDMEEDENGDVICDTGIYY